jgi:hypothetical protein
MTEVSQYVCDVCGKAFEKPMQLQGHRTSHATPTPCDLCGKEYKTPGALGNHRKNTHGVISAGSVERQKRKASQPDMDWRADDIFQTVVSLIWPGGTIPTGAILPLIQWRDDTQVMLEKIQHG